MKWINGYLLLSLLFLSGSLYGQRKLFGTISEQGKTNMLSGALVILSGSEQDTLGSVFTGNDGRFSFDSIVFVPEKYYSVKVRKDCYHCSFAAIFLEDTAGVEFGEVNLNCMRLMDCLFNDNIAFFSDNDSKTIFNFDADQFKHLMAEYPTMAVQFSLYQLPEENDKLGKERLKTFQELLEKEGVDVTRVQIDPEVHYYKADERTKEELKPGISGVIKGFD